MLQFAPNSSHVQDIIHAAASEINLQAAFVSNGVVMAFAGADLANLASVARGVVNAAAAQATIVARSSSSYYSNFCENLVNESINVVAKLLRVKESDLRGQNLSSAFKKGGGTHEYNNNGSFDC